MINEIMYFTALYIIGITYFSWWIQRPATGGVISDDHIKMFCNDPQLTISPNAPWPRPENLTDFEKYLTSDEFSRNIKRSNKAGREMGLVFRKFISSVNNTEISLSELKTAMEKVCDENNKS